MRRRRWSQRRNLNPNVDSLIRVLPAEGNDDDLPRKKSLVYSSDSSEEAVRIDFSDDLLHRILDFLDNPIDLCRAAGVCRQWRAVTASEDLWRCLNFQDSRITRKQFYDLCRRCPSVVNLSICGGETLVGNLVEPAARLLRNLETLVLGECFLNTVAFRALEGCLSLRSLSIMDASIGERKQMIIIHHSKLRNLSAIKCRGGLVVIRCPQVEVLSMRSSRFDSFTLNCPKIHELDFNSFYIPREERCLAVTSCPLLTTLDLANGSNVMQEMLSAIGEKCTHLRTLVASNCSSDPPMSVVFPELTVLKLDRCPMIDSASMSAISKSLLLEVLEIRKCDALDSVSLNFRYLHTLKLEHCSIIAVLSLESHMLSSITVSSCFSLRCINLTSRSLQILVLQGLEGLTTLTLDCPGLQTVDLTGSKSLMDFVCDVFSDGGGCPALTSLVLDCCESLTAVKLRSTSLVSLSLVGCWAMISLDLSCPNLKQGLFDGYDNLEKASFCPVGFESLNLGVCPKLSTLLIEAFQLEVLKLHMYGSLSKISVHCPGLVSLDTSFCCQLTDVCMDARTTTSVTSLILMSCPHVASHRLISLQCLTHLTLLDLSYTYVTSLEPIFQSCLQLEVLKLQACKYLTDYSLEPIYRKGALPFLCELDLSHGCQSRSTLMELLASCTRLTRVSLSGCVNMCDLDWGVSSCQQSELSSSMVSLEDVWHPITQSNHLLQHLNCVGCPNIKKVVIPAAFQWVFLSSLNLSLSVNLKEVDLTCSNMRFLNLSNCSSLETLKLDCPRLASLFLRSCNIVEEAMEVVISHCSELKTLDVRDCPKIDSVSIGKLRAVCPSLKRILSSF